MAFVRRILCPTLAVMALGLVSRAAADEALPKGSPFMPAGSPAAAAIAPGEMIEFAAVRTIGTRTEIDLYDTQGKKNHWIPVGASADGMTVVSYDARRDQVVAKIGGMDKVLPLRRTKGSANAPAPIIAQSPAMSFATPLPTPAPAPTPVAPAAAPSTVAEGTAPAIGPTPPPATAQPAPAVPLTIARQEEEARMLVSDLLEIGMAQRKAYEEKQRQLADPNAAQPPPPNAPSAQPAPGGPPTGI